LTSSVTDILPVANGGTGSSTQNFVDLTSPQTVAGAKTFSSNASFNGQQIGVGSAAGGSNLAVGSGALNAVSTGHRNTAIGNSSMQNYIGTGFDNNTSLGYSNMVGLTTGSGNTSVGAESMMSLSTGTSNTSLGNQSLIGTTGNNNVGIGKSAGSTITTGTNNTIIGTDANVGTNSLTNSTALGYGAIVAADNTIQLGNSAITDVKTSGTITAGAITIPNTDGSNGQVLSTNGSGTLSWTSPVTMADILALQNQIASLQSQISQLQSATEAFSFVADYSNNASVFTTQKFDGTAWTNVAANPDNKYGSRIGKIGNEYFAAFYDSNGNTYSVHAFNGSTWRSVTTSGTAPTYIYGANLGVYNNKIYYHAYDGSGYSTYSFDGTNWAVASILGTPPPNGMGYMYNTQYIGEFNNKSYYSNISWDGSSNSYSLYTFDGATWTNSVSPGNYYYQFIGQLGTISYLWYYNGSGYSYATFDGTTFSNWTPTGLSSDTNGYNMLFLGVINNKMYTVYYDNSGGRTHYTFDGNTFTSLPNIAKPGDYFGGLDLYFLGGNLK
jgi:hypothetical protein